jgi:hypothetical protein
MIGTARIYLGVEITVYTAEISAYGRVLSSGRRSPIQPPLTEAARAGMALQALQNQRRDERHMEVSFDDLAS